MRYVVDMFCGVGGLTHGFLQHGKFNVIAGLDNDPSCRYAYEANNPGASFILSDLARDQTEVITEIASLFPPNGKRLLVGCAPCQPFSRYAQPHKRTAGKGDDEKWKLVMRFGEIVTTIAPEIVSMENVPELQNHCAFTDFIDTLKASGYHIWFSEVECVRFGVPQTRVRLVVLASRLAPIEFITETHSPDSFVTLGDTIQHLPPIAAGQCHPNDPLHRASRLSPLNLQRIQTSIPGGTWRDWPEELMLDCHRRETGKSFPSVYGRLQWEYPSSTITTQFNGIGNGRFGHPTQDRAISLREAALIQTFPEGYRFVPPGRGAGITALARHIGNAVPPRLGGAIAESIARHLDHYDECGTD